MNIRQELAEYLGNNYEPHKLNRYAKQDPTDKESLYYYTWRAWEDWWIPHLTFARENIAPELTVLDYQAGIGQFGVQLLDDYGYQVSFAEDKNKLGEFLRWRLKQRGVKSGVRVLNTAEPQDAVISFGTVEQAENPLEFIQHLSTLGGIIVFDVDSRQVDLDELDNVINQRVTNGYVRLFAIRSKT